MAWHHGSKFRASTWQEIPNTMVENGESTLPESTPEQFALQKRETSPRLCVHAFLASLFCYQLGYLVAPCA